MIKKKLPKVKRKILEDFLRKVGGDDWLGKFKIGLNHNEYENMDLAEFKKMAWMRDLWRSR